MSAVINRLPSALYLLPGLSFINFYFIYQKSSVMTIDLRSIVITLTSFHLYLASRILYSYAIKNSLASYFLSRARQKDGGVNLDPSELQLTPVNKRGP